MDKNLKPHGITIEDLTGLMSYLGEKSGVYRYRLVPAKEDNYWVYTAVGAGYLVSEVSKIEIEISQEETYLFFYGPPKNKEFQLFRSNFEVAVKAVRVVRGVNNKLVLRLEFETLAEIS